MSSAAQRAGVSISSIQRSVDNKVVKKYEIVGGIS